MLCAEQNAFWQEHRAAVNNYVAAIHALVGLVNHSAEDPAFNLAHLRIKATRGLCDVRRPALEYHELEHGCQK
jgi:hypothetical protein